MIKFLTILVIFLTLSVEIEGVFASPGSTIIIAAHENQEVHLEIIKNIEAQIYQQNLNKTIFIRSNHFSVDQFSNKKPGLVITIGTEVTQEILELHINTSILSIAIPRLSFEELRQRFENSAQPNDNTKLSAIYLDQPIDRRFKLIKNILPETGRVGVALSPNTEFYQDELNKAARENNFELNIRTVKKEENLVSTLNEILESSDVMLGIVDPIVFNRASARNVLLTAYRWRVPLIGISPSYVRAGALAAVYTTPSQIALQVSEIMEQFYTSKNIKELHTQFPKYFSVSVNYQVAESMGIHIVDEKSLHTLLLLSGEGTSK